MPVHRRASGSAAFRAQRHEPAAEHGRDRREAHQEPARRAERHRDGDRAGVQHDLVRARQLRRDHVHQPESQRGEPDAGERGQRREHQPFREHQAREPGPGRAERGADRELVTARRDPHQQERGDVGERAEQDQQHRAGKEPELLGGAAHDGVAERIGGEPGDAVPEAGAPERIDALADPGEIAGRVVEGDSRLEPPDAAEPERPAPGGRRGLEHRPRRGLHAGELVQAGRQHADDRVAHAVEREGAADRRPDAAEALRRQPRGDHEHRRCVGALVVGLDETAGGRRGAERGEEAGRDPGDGDLLRLAAAREPGHAHARRAEGIEAPLLLANRLDVHHREGPAVGRRVLLDTPAPAGRRGDTAGRSGAPCARR